MPVTGIGGRTEQRTEAAVAEARRAFTALKGSTVDPVAELGRVMKGSTNFMGSFTGLLEITGTETTIASDGASFTISGNLNFGQLADKVQKATAPVGANSVARKTFSSVLTQASQISSKLGIVQPTGTIPVTLTLKAAPDGASGTLGTQFPLVSGWWKSPPLKTIGTTLGASKLALNLSVEASPYVGTTVGVGLEGNVFAKPTAYDPWLELAPAVRISSDGELQFGSKVSGACAVEASTTAAPTSCTGDWDLFGVGLVKTKGGNLYPTVDLRTTTLSGVTAEILQARFAGVYSVDGALQIDADASPGAGLVLKTTTSSKLKLTDALNAMAGKHDSPALRKIRGAIGKIPGVSSLVGNASTEIVIAPFGFRSYNYLESTYAYRLALQTSLVNMTFNQELKGDVVKMLKNQGGTPTGQMGISLAFADLKSQIESKAKGKANWVGELLDKIAPVKVHGLSAQVGMDLKEGASATGTIDFEVFKKRLTPTVDLDVLMNPVEKIVELVLKEGHDEFAKLFSGCDPDDTACKRICKSYNLGYSCTVYDYAGTCKDTGGFPDRYTCFSQAYENARREQAEDRQARVQICSRSAVGKACYTQGRRGRCSGDLNRRGDDFICQ